MIKVARANLLTKVVPKALQKATCMLSLQMQVLRDMAEFESHIDIRVELDEQRIPVRIFWQAEEDSEAAPKETKALYLSCWDDVHQQTLRMELWTKQLRIEEMKRFYIDMLGSMSQGILSATGDAYMSEQLKKLCKEFAAYHKKELSHQSKNETL